MRGKVAKKLRKMVYGQDHSPRDRDYEKHWISGALLHKWVALKAGTLNAGDLRHKSQALKKRYKDKKMQIERGE